MKRIAPVFLLLLLPLVLGATAIATKATDTEKVAGQTPSSTGLSALTAADAAALRNAAGASSGVFSVAAGGTGASTLTGIVKGGGTSALTAATAGTDYYAPASTDVAVADGGTGASTAAGARANLDIVVSIPWMSGVSTWDPGDGLIYYFGPNIPAYMPSTVSTDRKIYMPAGKIVAIYGRYFPINGGTTNETSTLSIRHNDTTDYPVTSTLIFPSAAGTWTEISNTGLDIDVAQGDYVTLKLACPTWTTNPLDVYFYGYILVKL